MRAGEAAAEASRHVFVTGIWSVLASRIFYRDVLPQLKKHLGFPAYIW